MARPGAEDSLDPEPNPEPVSGTKASVDTSLPLYGPAPKLIVSEKLNLTARPGKRRPTMPVGSWLDSGPAQWPLDGPSMRGGESTAAPPRRHVICRLPAPTVGHTPVSTQSPLEPASVRRTRTVAVPPAKSMNPLGRLLA